MRHRIILTLPLFLLLVYAAPCSGQPASGNPRALFIAHPVSTPSDAALFTAVRAQLSGAMLTLQRVTATKPAPTEPAADLATVAPRLAEKHGAALVFWVEDKDPCRIYFFIPDDTGGRYSSRTIDVEHRNPSSRYDVIATVAAVMIEGLIIGTSPPDRAAKSSPTPPPPEEQRPTQAGQRRVELYAAYAGSLVAPGAVGHGGILGVGFLPLSRLFVGVSFGLYTPTTLSNDDLQIKLTSRQPSMQAAVRLSPSPFEIRVGLSYVADFRSYAAAPLDNTIRSREDDYNVIHAVVPFLFAAWTHRRFGVFGTVGASFSVNETVFRIRRATGEFTEEIEPFNVKFVYQLGLLVQL